MLTETPAELEPGPGLVTSVTKHEQQFASMGLCVRGGVLGCRRCFTGCDIHICAAEEHLGGDIWLVQQQLAPSSAEACPRAHSGPRAACLDLLASASEWPNDLYVYPLVSVCIAS